MLIKFMVKQASSKLKPILAKSPATISRAGITLSVDNRVIDRLGKMQIRLFGLPMLRCLIFDAIKKPSLLLAEVKKRKLQFYHFKTLKFNMNLFEKHVINTP